MEKIIIKNFGPIKEVELEIKPFTVFIGPQASGKSTISKTIYFFKSLRNDLLKYFIESIDSGNFDKPLGNIGKRIRAKFLNFFGPTAHIHNFYLRYEFGHKSITINLKKRYVNPVFSQDFVKEFNDILSYIKQILPKTFHRDPKFLPVSELLKLEQAKKSVLDELEKLVNELFGNDEDLLFIPAGRSLLTTLSDQLQYIHPHRLDYLMQSFIDRINATKPLFHKSLDDLIKDKEYLTNDTIQYGYVRAAKRVIESILKARYINDFEGEKLYVSDNKYVKINFSSSGQQESIWILNLIFISLLNNNKLFIVFEEPEAHLYPVAQKEMIDLVALLFNALQSQVILTTHSPYILSSINNLIYASTLREKGINIDKVISPKTIISYDKLDAFFVENGIIRSIIDNETHLIQSEAIDSVSEIINDTFDRLFDLDE